MRVTWNVYGRQFVGTVLRSFVDFDGVTMLSVKPDGSSNVACIFPPGSEFGTARWVN